jgi:hypothetical protein
MLEEYGIRGISYSDLPRGFLIGTVEIHNRTEDHGEFKFTHLDELLKLLKPSGIYIINDLLPQPSSPEDHAPKVEQLIADLEGRSDLVLTKMK